MTFITVSPRRTSFPAMCIFLLLSDNSARPGPEKEDHSVPPFPVPSRVFSDFSASPPDFSDVPPSRLAHVSPLDCCSPSWVWAFLFDEVRDQNPLFL